MKIFGLTILRSLRNLRFPVKRFRDTGRFADEPVLAVSESDLWNPSDNQENWPLTAGKIENLRIAARRLHGLEIGAGEAFSFWRQIGNPNFGKGYVPGREIREGCIVPTIAGGICQLSNALYDAALKAGFDILERHKHTEVIRGSLAESDRDATVKWNYLDLRFRSDSGFRIEVELGREKLRVSFKGRPKASGTDAGGSRPRPSSKLNDCYSCGNSACFRHPEQAPAKPVSARTAFILDEKWPEFDAYVSAVAAASDVFIVPLGNHRFLKTRRYAWAAMAPGNTLSTPLPGIYRALGLRLSRIGRHNVFASGLRLDRGIALAAARSIPVDATHLVVSQNLLPFLAEAGALGGRTFDVLMTRLPLERLHARLDLAHAIHPESPTLKDFRAPARLVELESSALTMARKVVTPHAEVAGIFKHKVERLAWKLPSAEVGKSSGSQVLFPASAAGRKGAYEMKRLAREFGFALTVAGETLEGERFWDGLAIERFDGDLGKIGLVVYPTYVEHQPRLVLKAVARGIPVVTTTACGLEGSGLVESFGLDAFESLRSALAGFLGRNPP